MPAHGRVVTEVPTHPSEDTRVEEPVIVKEDEAEVDLADVVVVVAVTADVVDEVVVAVASARELARHQSRLLRRHRHRPATNLQHLAKLKRVGFDEFFVFLCLFSPTLTPFSTCVEISVGHLLFHLINVIPTWFL